MRAYGCAYLLVVLLILAFWAGVIFVAAHFIRVYW